MKFYEEDAAKKEILTKEMLKKQLLQSHYLGIPIIVFIALPCEFLISVYKMLLTSLFPSKTEVISIVASCLYIAVIVADIIGVVYCVREIIMIKKDRFSIRKEKLVQTEERPDGHILFKPHYELHFQNGGRYEIYAYRGISSLPTQMYSEKISQSRIYASDFFDTANIGDVFILVVFNNRIAQVFNTKFFDLEEDAENL